MRIGRLALTLLLLYTSLWICSCDDPSEILTVEMRDYYQVHEPLLVSVIMPASGEMSELIFQINGTVYRTQHLPTEDDPMFYLTDEDGIQTAYLIVEGFWIEAARIVLQFLPNEDGEASCYWEDVWFGETEEFLPLQNWLQRTTTET